MSKRLIRLEAQNIKKIHAAVIEPGGESVVVIGGGNGAGKSSAIDCLEMLLVGKTSFPDRPVRDGEENAYIVGEFGGDDGPPELFITRKISGTTDTLTVKNVDGAKYPSPQRLLDGLYGKVLGFDPGRFADLGKTAAGGREQRAILLSVLGIDTSDLDAKRAGIFDERTGANALVRNAESNLERCPQDADAPTAQIDVSGVLAQIEAAREQNGAIVKMEAESVALQEKADTLISSKSRLEQSIVRLRKELQSTKSELAQLDKQCAAYVEEREVVQRDIAETQYTSTDAFTDKLNEAEAHNRRYEQAVARSEAEASVKKCKADANLLTKRIEDIDKEKRAVFAAADFGIDGLGFTDDGVTLNDIPLSQVSSAEQLRIAVGVAFRTVPADGIRVALIREGSLFDAASIKDLHKLAQDEDGLILLERVIVPAKGDPGYDDQCAACTVVFEDGVMVGGAELKGAK